MLSSFIIISIKKMIRLSNPSDSSTENYNLLKLYLSHYRNREIINNVWIFVLCQIPLTLFVAWVIWLIFDKAQFLINFAMIIIALGCNVIFCGNYSRRYKMYQSIRSFILSVDLTHPVFIGQHYPRDEMRMESKGCCSQEHGLVFDTVPSISFDVATLLLRLGTMSNHPPLYFITNQGIIRLLHGPNLYFPYSHIQHKWALLPIDCLLFVGMCNNNLTIQCAPDQIHTIDSFISSQMAQT